MTAEGGDVSEPGPAVKAYEKSHMIVTARDQAEANDITRGILDLYQVADAALAEQEAEVERLTWMLTESINDWLNMDGLSGLALTEAVDKELADLAARYASTKGET